MRARANIQLYANLSALFFPHFCFFFSLDVGALERMNQKYGTSEEVVSGLLISNVCACTLNGINQNNNGPIFNELALVAKC